MNPITQLLITAFAMLAVGICLIAYGVGLTTPVGHVAVGATLVYAGLRLVATFWRE